MRHVVDETDHPVGQAALGEDGPDGMGEAGDDHQGEDDRTQQQRPELLVDEQPAGREEHGEIEERRRQIEGKESRPEAGVPQPRRVTLVVRQVQRVVAGGDDAVVESDVDTDLVEVGGQQRIDVPRADPLPNRTLRQSGQVADHLARHVLTFRLDHDGQRFVSLQTVGRVFEMLGFAFEFHDLEVVGFRDRAQPVGIEFEGDEFS